MSIIVSQPCRSGVDLYPHCGVCHVSYSPLKLPSEGQMQNCSICKLVPTTVCEHYSTVSGLVISLECFIEITPDFLCPL